MSEGESLKVLARLWGGLRFGNLAFGKLEGLRGLEFKDVGF